jgi:protein-L-isoaspartate(D-aspartate) O-methyltransferase
MAQAAQLQPNDRVLEVGAGSGYAAAVLSRIARQVYAIERHALLATEANERCRALGYDNVAIRTGDGSMGWPEEAPFDAILVSAGGPQPPEALKQQLKIGGRLILPVGDTAEQRLWRIRRVGEAEFHKDDLGGVRFVPLIGVEGWHASSA